MPNNTVEGGGVVSKKCALHKGRGKKKLNTIIRLNKILFPNLILIQTLILVLECARVWSRRHRYRGFCRASKFAVKNVALFYSLSLHFRIRISPIACSAVVCICQLFFPDNFLIRVPSTFTFRTKR